MGLCTVAKFVLFKNQNATIIFKSIFIAYKTAYKINVYYIFIKVSNLPQKSGDLATICQETLHCGRNQ